MAADWRVDWKEDLGKTLYKGIIILLILVGFIMIISCGKNFWVTLKPGHDVNDLLDNGAVAGMHVSGQIEFTYDCFADMADTDSNRIMAYYYALPSADGTMILQVPVSLHDEMETLFEETLEYMQGGAYPESVVPIEGYVTKAQGRLPYLLEQYMLQIGYTQEEINAMGEPLMIEYATEGLQRARIYAPVGIILLSSGVLLTVLGIFLKRFKETKHVG